MNIFVLVNEIKMNKIWNGELIFIMKMFFCNLLPKTSSSQPLLSFIFILWMFIKTAMCLSTNTSDLLSKFSNESVKTILMKMTF